MYIGSRCSAAQLNIGVTAIRATSRAIVRIECILASPWSMHTSFRARMYCRKKETRLCFSGFLDEMTIQSPARRLSRLQIPEKQVKHGQAQDVLVTSKLRAICIYNQ